ncbi:FecCD family ABC transporter permease [Rufibacter glacialis]|uniref:FecCD family ABC transporter permease n=1 Tax=Rufibacter glacialis TaxID=1259555 RepID=A0A5M8QJB3_9BACT|nr:iron ABC transporter permease [Rufibacter glacialis]KAA6434432.1 iron ABC transporter permease [Rufibacter glacialis]GGK69537.1 iron transporter [Rufibacter glacialis]
MRKALIAFVIYGLPIPLLLYSLTVGPSQEVGLADFWDWGKAVWSGTQESNTRLNMINNIIENIRLPRVLLTFIIGAGLASSGGALQGIFRNPLVDPYVLGISSGSAFGAALAIAFPLININISAFVLGVVSVILTYSFAFSDKKASLVAVILSGMIVSGIFTALLTIVQYISDPYKLQAIVQWTMGNLHHASWDKINSAALPIAVGVGGMYLLRWRLNLLALGDQEARAVGVNPNRDKIILVVLATLTTSSSVAAAGIISLYGLFVPHLTRMMVGPDNRKAMPANILFGGSFLVIIDNFSRSLMEFEIPIGIFTMLLGAPFFIFLMKKNKINWV